MTCDLDISLITDFSDPVENPPWWLLDRPVERDRVMACFARGNFQEHHTRPMEGEAKNLADAHEHRIGWLMMHFPDDPISIDIGIGEEVRSGWIVEDGNHRLYAAILLGLKTVPCEVSGRCDLIERIFGTEAVMAGDPEP